MPLISLIWRVAISQVERHVIIQPTAQAIRAALNKHLQLFKSAEESKKCHIIETRRFTCQTAASLRKRNSRQKLRGSPTNINADRFEEQSTSSLMICTQSTTQSMSLCRRTDARGAIRCYAPGHVLTPLVVSSKMETRLHPRPSNGHVTLREDFA